MKETEGGLARRKGKGRMSAIVERYCRAEGGRERERERVGGEHKVGGEGRRGRWEFLVCFAPEQRNLG